MPQHGRQIDPKAGFDGKFGIGFGLLQHDRKSCGGNPRARIVDEPAADFRIVAGQQRVGHNFLQPPAARDGKQMRHDIAAGAVERVEVA